MMGLSPDDTMKARVRRSYLEKFAVDPELVVFAPGRINLIGEHTDYNDGFVLPAAIGFGVWMALGRNDTTQHRWYAHDTGDFISLSLSAPGPLNGWAGYFQGAYGILASPAHTLPAINCVFSSDLPVGAGLSSSSALTCGFLLGIDVLFGLQHSREELAFLAHRVEREYIGLQGGIMDQHACLLARAGHFLLLDCLTRAFSHIQYTGEGRVHLFLINTGVQHQLTETDYNTRASECHEALTLLNNAIGIESLRGIMDVDPSVLNAHLPPLLRQRVTFVQRENLRVKEAVSALQAQDWPALGKLLYESHAGLRDDYVVSCPELDFLVESTLGEPFILGARMMGGGFGGCTINFATNPPDEKFVTALAARYSSKFGLNPTFIPVIPGPGAQVH